ncbi:hypothetical protein AYO20_05593 [Fonsecaea nubica]|uniref:Uncharacterized protein n=1 Tax=Fonsecaea nubica TaxID=856822 RepID=A0A178D065_9EURO|nr:hypothetical protein AYO20_05593 [Fonsecaea nubica]OAL35116.1 hypothetical protein AYO20_05593 [Fonsecaea nubica]
MSLDPQQSPILLDGLPLALTQAAAYMQQTGIDFKEHIRLYNTRWKDLMQFHKKDGIPLPAYDRNIWTTWMISFEAIRQRNEATSNLLLFWAFLDHRDLWYGLQWSPTAAPDLCPQICTNNSTTRAASPTALRQ